MHVVSHRFNSALNFKLFLLIKKALKRVKCGVNMSLWTVNLLIMFIALIVHYNHHVELITIIMMQIQ